MLSLRYAGTKKVLHRWTTEFKSDQRKERKKGTRRKNKTIDENIHW